MIKLIIKNSDSVINTSNYSNLSEKQIIDRTLTKRQFSGCNYRKMSFKKVIFINCDFQATEITECDFVDCTFLNCNFNFSKFNDCNFLACKFDSCNFCITNSLKCNYQACVFIKNNWIESSINLSRFKKCRADRNSLAQIENESKIIKKQDYQNQLAA